MTKPPREDRVKHLEFILGIVSRLAGNSFLMKGWAITASVAIYTYAAQRRSWPIVLIGLVPAGAFCWLDAYYLRQERLFRCLYDAVRSGGQVDAFAMDTRPYLSNLRCSWMATVKSPTIAAFYGLIVGSGVVIALSVLLSSSGTQVHSRPSAPASHSPATTSSATPTRTSESGAP